MTGDNSGQHLAATLEILLELNERLKTSTALNGGFERMMAKVDKIEDSQEKMLLEFGEIKSTIYHPDQGIFSRIKTAEKASNDKFHQLDIDMKEMKLKLHEVTEWKKTAERVFWRFLLPAFSSGFLKLIYDYFSTHLTYK